MATPGMQAAFDKAVHGILAQGGRSLAYINGRLTCAYRGEGGKKCAVGHLLSDEQIEGYGVAEATNPGTFPGALLKELIPDVEVKVGTDFLWELQAVHDNCSDHNFANSFFNSAKRFAINRGLTFPSINDNQ